MNILDENIIDSQRYLLRRWRFAVRQIGYEIGRQGMKDEEIIVLLHQLGRSTFLTRDMHFYDRNLCHARYCLVYMAIRKDEVAVFVRRFLRHSRFNSITKRMGSVIRLSHAGLLVWRLHAQKQLRISWDT